MLNEMSASGTDLQDMAKRSERRPVVVPRVTEVVSGTVHAQAGHIAQIEGPLAGRMDTVPTVTIDSMFFHRMFTACTLIRKLVAENPVQPDTYAEHEAVQAWAFVTAAYNGIEQALKMLLLAPAEPAFTLDDLKKSPYGHDLETLYAELAPSDRDYTELHFGEHWSLNEFEKLDLGFGTAQEFIVHLNKSHPQGGSLAWRYALLDMSVQLPKTNLWTMCEVWYAICCRIKNAIFGRQDHTFRLSGRLFFAMKRVTQSTPAPYDGFIDDLGIWMTHRDGDYLAAWVDLLAKANRGAMSEVQAAERLLPELARMADRVIAQMSLQPPDLDIQKFLLQVQRTDRDLVWNPLDAKFGWTDDMER